MANVNTVVQTTASGSTVSGWGEPAPTKNTLPYIQDLVTQDIESRKQHGIEKYGTALQPFNDRNVLQDIYEEDLDRTMYMRQLIEELRTLKREYGVNSLSDIRERLQELQKYQEMQSKAQLAVLGGESMIFQMGVLADVSLERDRQNEKWGEQNHSPIEWMTVLMEEVGEAAEMVNKTYWTMKQTPSSPIPLADDLRYLEKLQQYRAEMVQVAAVAVAAIESLDRNELA